MKTMGKKIKGRGETEEMRAQGQNFGEKWGVSELFIVAADFWE